MRNLELIEINLHYLFLISRLVVSLFLILTSAFRSSFVICWKSYESHKTGACQQEVRYLNMILKDLVRVVVFYLLLSTLEVQLL